MKRNTVEYPMNRENILSVSYELPPPLIMKVFNQFTIKYQRGVFEREKRIFNADL